MATEKASTAAMGVIGSILPAGRAAAGYVRAASGLRPRSSGPRFATFLASRERRRDGGDPMRCRLAETTHIVGGAEQ